MKIVILGSDGQLGNELSKNFFKEGNLKIFSKKTLDITNLTSVQNMIEFEKPSILINAAAYTAVDKAEVNKEYAFNVNSKAVKNIAKSLEKSGSYLIHYSTDYVFDGLKETPYVELDHTSPINVYGRSKLEGEKNIMKYMSKYYILRTSWVIGEHGKNFAKTILRLFNEKDSLEIVDDQFGVPTSTRLISKVTEKIVSEIKKSNPLKKGIYNISPEGKTSWFGISMKIQDMLIEIDSNFKNKQFFLRPISSLNYPTLALRPKNSLLDSTKIKKCLDFDLPYWEDDLNDTLKSILKN